MFLRRTGPLLRAAQRSMSTANTNRDGLFLTFASPAKSIYKDTKVKQVDVPSYSGSLGILANHVPILAVIKPGVVTVYDEEGNLNKFFVAAGTVTMNEDSSLLILASEAVALEDLDASEAQKNLSKVDMSTAEGQIRAEVNQALVEALR